MKSLELCSVIHTDDIYYFYVKEISRCLSQRDIVIVYVISQTILKFYHKKLYIYVSGYNDFRTNIPIIFINSPARRPFENYL